MKNEDYPFRAFDVKVTEEWGNNTKRRLILETRDIEDAIELNRSELARHLRFDDRYSWQCEGCSHELEYDEGLINVKTYQKMRADGGIHIKKSL